MRSKRDGIRITDVEMGSWTNICQKTVGKSEMGETCHCPMESRLSSKENKTDENEVNRTSQIMIGKFWRDKIWGFLAGTQVRPEPYALTVDKNALCISFLIVILIKKKTARCFGKYAYSLPRVR